MGTERETSTADLVSIGIDTGGTFTDGFLVCGSRRLQAKVATTPHDLTECFVNILEALAAGMEMNLRDLLRRTGVIRYASTVGTNALIQRTGPKLGLITTAGSPILEHYRSSAGTQWLVGTEMIRAVDEQTSADGTVVRAVDQNQVRQAAEEIVDQGARAIAISFGNSAFNAENERIARQVVRSEYPPYYLGSVPVLTAHDVTIRVGDLERTNTVLLSAYLRPDLVKYLYRMEEFLREQGYNRPLLIAHSTGGVSRVAKSTPLQTYNSGPVSGLLGSLEFATNLYDHESVVTMDMGGTSLDVGLVTKGTVPRSTKPLISGLPVNVPMVELGIFGAGGGSIASMDASGELTVGPRSAGAVPGPAAYGLGGTEPTVSDANLVLGYLDPKNFLGGRRSLYPELSQKAFAPLAEQAGTDAASVAWKVKTTVEANMSRAIGDELRARGADPAKTIVYSYGGASGIHVAAVARALGCSRVIVFPFCPVFCAAGASTLDVMHLYEQFLSPAGRKPGDDDAAQAAAIASTQWEAAVRDMRGEGHGWESIRPLLQLETTDAAGAEGRLVEVPIVAKGAAIPDLAGKVRESLQPGERIRIARLVARMPVASPEFPQLPRAAGNASVARTGSRPVHWGKGFEDTPVYDSDKLGVGHVVSGPAVLEGTFTTVALERGWKYLVDGFGIGVMEVEQ